MNLADPYLKTARAKEHLDALRKELIEFTESQPCEFQGRSDVANQRYRIRILVKDPPERLSLIAGDVFCCLRASLDHLVWALASNGIAYPKGTQFPILEQLDADLFARRTRGVPTEAATIIESLQPYHGKDTPTVRSHLLWRLNKLCNIDKHMRIPAHGSIVDFKLPEAVAPFCKFDADGIMNFPLHLKDRVALYPFAVHSVTFGDTFWNVQCDGKGIEEIYEFVTNNVIPRFAKFFS